MTRMLSLSLSLLTLALTACGSNEHPVSGFDESIQEKINEIQRVADENGVKTREQSYGRIVSELKFDAGEGLASAGLCSHFEDGSAGIQILEPFSKDPVIFDQVVFHELGHCMLDLDHGDTRLMKGKNLIPYEEMADSRENLILDMVMKRKSKGQIKKKFAEKFYEFFDSFGL